MWIVEYLRQEVRWLDENIYLETMKTEDSARLFFYTFYPLVYTLTSGS